VSDPPAAGPTVHGVYDYWLRGGQHLRADRELGRAIAERFPRVPEHVRAAHEFHLRAAVWCAERGVSRFVRTGHLTAPPGRNVHDAVRGVDPAARVIYASQSEAAHEWAQALLSGDPGHEAVLTGEDGILAERPVRAMLADGKPVCVIAGMVLHFTPAGKAAWQVARVAAALPPGSFLAVSVALLDSSRQAGELAAMFTPARLYRHTAEDVAGWLEDAGLQVAPPGVADVTARGWAEAARPPGFIAGGVAVKR
jgi:hypothetical protein